MAPKAVRPIRRLLGAPIQQAGPARTCAANLCSKGNFGASSQSDVICDQNSSLSHSQRLSGVSIDPSLRLTSVSLPSLTAFSSVSARQAPESAEIAQDNPCNLMRWSGQCGRRPRVPEIALVMWSDVQWSPRGSGRSPSTQPRAISGILGRLPLPRPHHDVARVLSGNLGTLGHSRALSGALGHSREPVALETDEKAGRDCSETEVRRSVGSIETPLRRQEGETEVRRK